MVRVSREIQKLQTDLPPEITCWPDDENIYDKFSAVMKGPPDSPYFGGKFSLAINLPSRYPYEAPKVNFVTRIYHQH
ncbi:Ubiquitin-conjugating enzyme E2 T [Massospora cicadina]|nr:Ubiquitin-conjugating enzyme E2 T [Massospora cicadina]